MALYYPQVKALVQGTRGFIPAASSNNWDIFTSTGYDSSSSTRPYGSITGLDTWSNSMFIEYGVNGIELGDRGSAGGTGHCGMATTGSTYVVDLTKDFNFYWVEKVYGTYTDRDATMVGFYKAPLGSTTGGNYPTAPIPKNSSNFGITVGGWYMRKWNSTHNFWRRTSSSASSFSQATATNVQTGKSYSNQASGTFSYYWNVNEFRYTHSNLTFEYHQHRYFNGSGTFAGTTSQGTAISSYYTADSHFYDFVLPSGGWNTPSSIDLTNVHVYISTMNPSSSGNQRIIPRFGIVQS